MLHKPDETIQLIRELFRITKELQARLPTAHFTIDGHLLSSVGKAIAAMEYGLEILEKGSLGHDARASDGRLVQVKATQGDSIAVKSEPRHLIVLHFGSGAEINEVYNGPGGEVWNACGPPSKAGQRRISFAKLRELLSQVSDTDRVQRIR